MRATTFTIISRAWEFCPSQLSSVNPSKLLRVLLTDLYAHGAREAGGWLFAYLHGEYDPAANVFRLHVHGLASWEMIAIIDRLRQLPRYKAVKTLPDGVPSAVYRRIWVRRKPLVNLPEPLTYVPQSYWPSRPIFISAEGIRRRVREKRRIPEPYHSLVLLWLDRWQLSDLTLTVGLHVTREGLKLNRRTC